MSSSHHSRHDAIEELEEILRLKVGNAVGVITTGGSITFGTVAEVKDDVLILATTRTFSPGLPVVPTTATIAYIPLYEIVTVLENVVVPA